MKLIYKLLLIAIGFTFLMTGCKKERYEIIAPPAVAHFLGDPIQIYSVTVNPPPEFKVAVGTTDVTNADRTFNYTVSSTTGAVAGTHYTIAAANAAGTVVIPAGQAIGYITMNAIFAPYQSGRKDTLIFALTNNSMKVPGFLDTVKIVLRGPCFEGAVNVAGLLGNYANTKETFGTGAPYGPYLTKITSAVSTGPTSATIVVTNIWNNGWGPITFNLDWTDPANRTAIVVAQAAIPGSNGGDLSATYAGQTIAVRGFSTNPGTFSVCNNTLTLRMQLGVTGVGYFSQLYTVNMAR